MVFIESKKYACETCIKGHRSSACKHTDRPLFEIKKKGRPVTQCEHCRELRKTKQVHVKCICELKTTDPKKGGTKAPESAVFPNGLPQSLAMEASVAHSESSSFNFGCTCMTGPNGLCQCCTPRKSAPRPRRKTESAVSPSTSSSVPSSSLRPTVMSSPPALDTRRDPPVSPAPRAASHILARISELRPVLPRPSVHHDPSSGIAHGHFSYNRHHHESSSFFSPYGRAYDINHHHHQSSPSAPATADDLPDGDRHFPTSTPAAPTAPAFSDRRSGDAAVHNSMHPLPPSMVPPPAQQPTVTFPSPCGCGDGCACPGCYHHSNTPFAPSLTAYPTCQNPSNCHACLDCTILSLPPDTALSIPQPHQAEVIDEWIRQIASTNQNGDASNATAAAAATGQWDPTGQLAQLPGVGGRRQCATCGDSSIFCTCKKELEQEDCCQKPRASSVDMDMGSMIGTTAATASGSQVYDSSGFFDYTMLGIPSQHQQQPPSSSEGGVGGTNSAPSSASASAVYLEASLRSRSPSISPHHELFTSFNHPPSTPSYLGDRMPAPQQSMYINGRGFYSDPYLSLGNSTTATERPSPGFGVMDTTGTGATFLPGLSDYDYPVGTTYAVSNPDSDTSSSFDSSSVDDFTGAVAGAAPPPPPPPSSRSSVNSSSRNNNNSSLRAVKQSHSPLSVSPVSFEDVRTLY